tara:strand:+ start:1663 stop:2349 length:687 start_codon:yes stop_codon:yes gene_type:complete
MKFPLLIILLSFLLISCEEEEDFSQPFYVDENGVTIKAKDWVTVGTTGVLNGITYTAVDNIKISESDFKSKYPEIIELKQLVTTLVTDMSILSGDYMIFGSFDDFKSIETWDVSNVTSMAGLFNTCNCFNPNYVNIENIPDLTYWDVSSVTNMSGMFYHIYGGAMFNQDISGWDVSNVTNMYRMLMGSNQFNQDLSSWDVSKVTNCDQFSDWTAKWTLPKPNFPISCN